MPTELKEKYPFSVDSWTALSRRKRHNFLTHAHSDHTSGIESFADRLIYCSDTTRRLLLRRFPELHGTRFVILEVGEAKMVLDDEQPFTVTALEANHCPGALMLLFEGDFGNVLHTGDCRLTEEYLQNALGRYIAQQRILDCVFLDCTFGKERVKMPSKKEAFDQVLQCILNNPQAPVVYLACDLLGQEELLNELVAHFRTRIYVDKNALPDYFADMMVVAPDLVTEDPESTRLHVCEGFPKLYERAKIKFMRAHKLRQPEPLFIRPSAQWYAFGERLEGAGSGMILDVSLKRHPTRQHRALPVPKAAERDQHGVWHVCYSMHSSRSELERAMEILWAKEVISTTPNCHASEVVSEGAGLHHIDVSATMDRVCSGQQKEVGTTKVAPKRSLNAYPIVCSPKMPRNRKKSCFNQTPKTEEDDIPNLSLNVVPLFGMARHCIPPSPPLSFTSTESESDQEFFDSDYYSDGSKQSPRQREVECPLKDRANLPDTTCGRVSVQGLATVSDRIVEQPTKIVIGPNKSRSEPSSLSRGEDEQMGDKENTLEDFLVCSKGNNNTRGVAVFKDSTRKLYRSLCVPIPAALPSLVDLYNLN